MKRLALLLTAALLAATLPVFSQQKKAAIPQKSAATKPSVINNYYRVEDIATPPALSVEAGGIAFMPDGRLVVCFHHGEVYTYDIKKKSWKLFAEGLHDPLGIAAT